MKKFVFHVLPRITLSIVFLFCTRSLQAQTCTSNAPGEWSPSIFTCTGSATLATASAITIQHPVTITGVEVLLTQDVDIALNNSLTISKTGATDGVLNLTNINSTVFVSSGGGLVSGNGGNNNVLQIGGTVYSGNQFANINSQAPITLNAGGLPITLSHFALQQAGAQVKLVWNTANETNNDYFAVEHSGDATRWQSVGTIKGNGSTEQAQSYSFTHQEPKAGLNYYRLRQTDIDGRFSLSEVRAIQLDADNKTVLAPNPVSASTQVQLSTAFEEATIWSLLSVSGSIVATGFIPANTHQFSVDMSQVPNGIYVFQYMGQDQQLYNSKIVVAH